VLKFDGGGGNGGLLARYAHGEVLSGYKDAARYRCYQGWYARGYVAERAILVPVGTEAFDRCVSGR
jgi:hypothetical protein